MLLAWKDGTTSDQISAIEAALARMPEVMPFIRRYEMGSDLGIGGSHDFAIVADFDNEADYRVYAEHPDHQAVLTDLLGPVVESKARVQYAL
ncbi:MAG: Dabb family protein [Acidimicrobiia bacterium]